MTDKSASPAAEVGYKVFVGNLSFKTTNEDLQAFFGAVGSVLEANIIKRGKRSYGYGFVTFENEKDATKCVEQLNKKELDGRTINVESATPRDPDAPTQSRPNSARGRRARGRGRPRGTSSRNSEERGEPSKTGLFIANLPFKFQDEDLMAVFAPYNPVKAHVIVRRNGMSKGFGFVEFSNESDQQKAFAAMQNFVCEGRELAVKVALGSEHVPTESESK